MNTSIQCSFPPGTDTPVFNYFHSPRASLGAFDIAVRVNAVSVNPVDYKMATATKQRGPLVLGWDVAGVIEEIGSAVTGFAPGEEVYYAGDITRPGGNTQLHLVDARVIAHKPSSLSFAEAAAVPLTGLTAWEGLFDCLKIDPKNAQQKTLLVIGGAGGVGSMVIQIAKKCTNLTVIATASRPESIEWCQTMGADHVVNHHSLETDLRNFGYNEVDYIYCTSDTTNYFPLFSRITAPFGAIVSIVEAESALPIGSLKSKSISFSWEFMFTRTMFKTADMKRQGEILRTIAQYLTSGKLRTTAYANLGAMTPERLADAHTRLRSGTSIGKIVLEGLE